MADIAILGIKIDPRMAVAGAKKVGRELDKLGNKSKRVVNKMRRGFSSLKKSLFSLQSVFLQLGATIVGGIILKIGSDFEQAMATVGGVMRATDSEMAMLTATAREMGATTEWSATQAGKALQFLGMAGFGATEAAQALPGVLDLATAGNLQLGTAADIASNALTAMGLEVEELGRVNDVFVATITRSNTNIEQLAEAFKYAAPTAHSFGVEIESLSAMIGMLGNAGIQGSMAGTQLAFAMTKTEKVFKKLGMDGEGKSFVDALYAVKAAGMDTNEILNIFGQRGGKAVLVMKDQTDALWELEWANKTSHGEAKTLADVMRNTVGNSFKELTSLITDKVITAFTKAQGGIRDLLEMFKTLVKNTNISDLAESVASGMVWIAESLKGGITILRFFERVWLGLRLTIETIAWAIVDAVRMIGDAIVTTLRPLDLLFDGMVALGMLDSNPLQNMQDALQGYSDVQYKAASDTAEAIDAMETKYDNAEKAINGSIDLIKNGHKLLTEEMGKAIAGPDTFAKAFEDMGLLEQMMYENAEKAKAVAREAQIAAEVAAGEKASQTTNYSSEEANKYRDTLQEINNLGLTDHENQLSSLFDKYDKLDGAIPDIEDALGVDGDALQLKLWDEYENKVAKINEQFEKRNSEAFFQAQVAGMSETDQAVAQLNHQYENQIQKLREIGEQAPGSMDKVRASIETLSAAQIKAVDDLKKKQKEAAEDEFWQLQLAGMTEAEAAIATVENTYENYFDKLRDLREDDKISEAEYTDTLASLRAKQAEDMENAVNAHSDSYKRMQEIANSFESTVSDGLTELFETGDMNFKELAKSFAKSIQKMMADWIAMELKKKMFGQAGGAKSGGGWLGMGMQLASAYFGGGHNVGGAVGSSTGTGGGFNMGGGRVSGLASGGLASGMQPYLVGEEGPELFVPRTHGTVIPNHQMGGGSSSTINVNVPADRQNNFRSTASQIGKRINSQLQRSQKRNG